MQDVTERLRSERRLQHLADHDPLTALLNRRRLMEELDRAVTGARRFGTHGALLLIDLDDFAYVNDSLGHAAGDDLLVRTADALGRRLPPTATLARLGGDEFGVIVAHADADQALVLAMGLLDTIRALTVGARRLTASVGIAVFGPDLDEATTSHQLLVQADTAMYDAKDSGRARVAVFDRSNLRQTAMEKRLDAAERLREALGSERLVLQAQPIVSAWGAPTSHYELLVRMRAEDGQLLHPEDFLGVAVQFDLIRTIDRWVIGEAVRLLSLGRALGRPMRLNVNLSAQSILDPDLPDWVAGTIEAAGVPGSGLVFEVTETDAAVNFESANRLAQRLSALGCAFALDDFGTGFCSLHYIKHLRFDYLKIDGEFVRDLLSSDADQLIVQAAVDIAHGLGRRVVAEGVQDATTMELLRTIGVDLLQGFHVGRPRPADEMLRLLLRQAPLLEGARGTRG